ncbi:hypothetical protein L1987_28494 [Smallanthus sonchifolius]|uniref:Uncharacterized protein n=1 Tax=Smallanthus sonchifolius TaxID=185202 RepID=A0ACB9HXE2_9ASTR|nr:hypothetical protein L1987_28494 [Smallanthus sonchifolius]
MIGLTMVRQWRNLLLRLRLLALAQVQVQDKETISLAWSFVNNKMATHDRCVYTIGQLNVKALENLSISELCLFIFASEKEHIFCLTNILMLVERYLIQYYLISSTSGIMIQEIVGDTIHFTRTAIFNISKANIPRFTSLSFPQKASRVCFTSASKHSQGKHASEETNNPYNRDESISYSGGKSSEHAGNKMEEGKDRMKEGAGEMKDISKDKANDMAGRAANKAGEVKDKANDMAGRAADRAGEMKDKAKEKSRDMKESAQETASEAADKADEGRRKAAEMAKAAKDKTMDAAGAVAEKTKQTVAGAWDAAKESSQKIKESVVGTSSSSDNDGDDGSWGDDRARKPKKVVDEDVANLRRKVGNLDHEKKDY